MERQVTELRAQTANAIRTLALSYQSLMKDAEISPDDVLEASRQKLQIDVHTMEIDQAARSLLTCIRKIKELKVTDNTYQGDREKFEEECKESTQAINQQVNECYQQLSDLSNEGFAILQEASKLLR